MLTLNKLYRIEHCEIIGLCKYLPEYPGHQTLIDEKIYPKLLLIAILTANTKEFHENA